jgi:hypothetical protein
MTQRSIRVLPLPARLGILGNFRATRTVLSQGMRRSVTCEPNDWRSKVALVVAKLLAVSQKFQLPQHAVDRVCWLADSASRSSIGTSAAKTTGAAALKPSNSDPGNTQSWTVLQVLPEPNNPMANQTYELPQNLGDLMGAYDEAHWQTVVAEIKPNIDVLQRGTILAIGSGGDVGKLVLLTAGTEAQSYGVLLDSSIDTAAPFFGWIGSPALSQRPVHSVALL